MASFAIFLTGTLGAFILEPALYGGVRSENMEDQSGELLIHKSSGDRKLKLDLEVQSGFVVIQWSVKGVEEFRNASTSVQLSLETNSLVLDLSEFTGHYKLVNENYYEFFFWTVPLYSVFPAFAAAFYSFVLLNGREEAVLTAYLLTFLTLVFSVFQMGAGLKNGADPTYVLWLVISNGLLIFMALLYTTKDSINFLWLCLGLVAKTLANIILHIARDGLLVYEDLFLFTLVWVAVVNLLLIKWANSSVNIDLRVGLELTSMMLNVGVSLTIAVLLTYALGLVRILVDVLFLVFTNVGLFVLLVAFVLSLPTQFSYFTQKTKSDEEIRQELLAGRSY